ncbi:MAG TPA: FeoA family protein [Oscillatoriaceae cyanobacterium]
MIRTVKQQTGLLPWLAQRFGKPAPAPAHAATLADLRPGDSARIMTLEGRGPMIQRLYEMGLIEGSEVTLVRRAPLGDPLEIRVMGYALSLRTAEASRIRVYPQ